MSSTAAADTSSVGHSTVVVALLPQDEEGDVGRAAATELSYSLSTAALEVVAHFAPCAVVVVVACYYNSGGNLKMATMLSTTQSCAVLT